MNPPEIIALLTPLVLFFPYFIWDAMRRLFLLKKSRRGHVVGTFQIGYSAIRFEGVRTLLWCVGGTLCAILVGQMVVVSKMPSFSPFVAINAGAFVVSAALLLIAFSRKSLVYVTSDEIIVLGPVLIPVPSHRANDNQGFSLKSDGIVIPFQDIRTIDVVEDKIKVILNKLGNNRIVYLCNSAGLYENLKLSVMEAKLKLAS